MVRAIVFEFTDDLGSMWEYLIYSTISRPEFNSVEIVSCIGG